MSACFAAKWLATYLCRWPNGDFSFVKADSRREAVLELDELGAAHSSFLYPMDTCIVDFGLNDSGEIVLNRFGEETNQTIWEKCYPELDRVLSSDAALATADVGYSDDVKKAIHQAVEHERSRSWDNQPKDEAETEAGRRLQQNMGIAGAVADEYIKQAAKQILNSNVDEDKKPN